MAGRNEGPGTVAHGRSEFGPTTAIRSATVDMTAKRRLNPRKPFSCSISILENVWRGFRRKMHKKSSRSNSIVFIGLSCHFIAMSAAAIVVTIAAVTQLRPHATICFLILPPMMFHFCVPFSCYENTSDSSHNLYSFCTFTMESVPTWTQPTNCSRCFICAHKWKLRVMTPDYVACLRRTY
jgi:hypothetical protein